jgi:hypothetical protein
MSEMMDYVNAVLIGGMLMLNVMSANQIAAETHSVLNGDVLVQEMLITTAQCVEGEFRNMGYGVPELDRVVMSADSTGISFLCDLGRDGGMIDTVRYWLGSTAEMASTMNPNDRFLHRTVNGTLDGKVGAVTQFNLRYMTTSGEVLAAPVTVDRLSEIREIEITMEVQNPFALQANTTQMAESQSGLFSTSYWQQTRLASQNLRR